jgi:hypothetical protein
MRGPSFARRRMALDAAEVTTWMQISGPVSRSTLISNIQSQVTAMLGVGFYIPPFFIGESDRGVARK